MSNPVATILIPFSEQHRQLAEAAIASARAQTVAVDVIADLSPNTPAYLRNLPLRETIDTPFIVFLDADDVLEPDFVAQCLHAYEPGHYVYTAWYHDTFIMRPRACNPYLAHDFHDGEGVVGGWHFVTTLMPTQAFIALGGFDETLPGMEDTDLYMRAGYKGLCGKYLDKPLVHYRGGDGHRSHAFRDLPEYHDLRRSIYERNGGILASMCNAGCNGTTPGSQAPLNAQGKQEGDIQAIALYTPSAQYGRVTGRYYERTRFQGQVIDGVSPLDVKAAPDLWKEVPSMKELTPSKSEVLRQAGIL